MFQSMGCVGAAAGTRFAWPNRGARAGDSQDRKEGVRTPNDARILVQRNARINLCGSPPEDNGPKDVGHMHSMVQDAGSTPCQHSRMTARCPRCGYELRVWVSAVGGFRVLVWSGPEGEVERCPRCGTRLPGRTKLPGSEERPGGEG